MPSHTRAERLRRRSGSQTTDAEKKRFADREDRELLQDLRAASGSQTTKAERKRFRRNRER